MQNRPWERWDDDKVVDILEKDWSGEALVTLRNILRGLADVVKGGSVLDVGCGTGRAYPICHELGFGYRGIDVTPAMVRRAMRNFPKGDFAVGDGYHLEFPDQSFDIVLCHDVLVHVPEPLPIVKELFRVTRKLAVVRLSYIYDAVGLTADAPARDNSYGLVFGEDNGFLNVTYRMKDAIRMFAEAGFRHITVVPLDLADRTPSDQYDKRKYFVLEKGVP